MTYNSQYFVATYFPAYFQTVRKTDPLYRWISCGWTNQTPQWIDGEPCPVVPVITGKPVGGWVDWATWFRHNAARALLSAKTGIPPIVASGTLAAVGDMSGRSRLTLQATAVIAHRHNDEPALLAWLMAA